MKRFFAMLFSMLFMFSFTACGEETPYQELASREQENTDDSTNNQNGESMTTYQIRITVGNHELTATLQDNATTRAFVDMLPVTLLMLDLYGREMCYRFPDALPTDDVNTCGYEVGEIVYYPPMDSFVILYAQNGERFSMQKLGKVNGDVSVFDGIGNVDVYFERIR